MRRGLQQSNALTTLRQSLRKRHAEHSTADYSPSCGLIVHVRRLGIVRLLAFFSTLRPSCTSVEFFDLRDLTFAQDVAEQ
jgi:hypothetical protein